MWSLEVNGTTFNLDATNGVVVTAVQGASMPPVANVLREFALLDGGYVLRSRMAPRVITFAIDVAGSSWSTFKAFRRALSEAVAPGQRVRIIHTDGSVTRYMDAWYDGGLEGQVTNGFVESGLLLRFLAPDPYWYEAEQEAVLTASNVISAQLILAENSGVWDNLSGGLSSGAVYTIAEGPDGALYVGGHFATTGGGLPVGHIAKWTGAAWESVGGGVTGVPIPEVRKIVFDAQGNLYAVGKFTQAGGTATIGIARWTGATWESVGGGLDNSSDYINDIVIGRNGAIYVGGAFTSIGGVSAQNLARYSGGMWTEVGDGVNNVVNALAYDAATDTLYVGGMFTQVGSTAANYIAAWDGTNWQTLGLGTTAQVLTLMWDSGERALYVGGAFRYVNGLAGAGGISANYIAKWTGYSWLPLGSATDNGVNSNVYGIYRLSDGNLILTGDFTMAAGDVRCGRVVKYNGYAFTSVGAYIPDGLWDYGRVVYQSSDGTTYIGGGFETIVPVSAITTVMNSGNAPSHVTVEITATAWTPTFFMLKNETTGAALWGSYVLREGETLTINTAPTGAVAISSVVGADVSNVPLPGSALATFRVAGGENKISVFVYDVEKPDGAATVTMRWSPAHYGVE